MHAGPGVIQGLGDVHTEDKKEPKSEQSEQQAPGVKSSAGNGLLDAWAAQ
jgi:hypothetical protein